MSEQPPSNDFYAWEKHCVWVADTLPGLLKTYGAQIQANTDRHTARDREELIASTRRSVLKFVGKVAWAVVFFLGSFTGALIMFVLPYAIHYFFPTLAKP